MIKQLKSYGTLALSVALLYLVVRKVGVDELLVTIAQANWLWVLLSVCLAPLIIFTGVIKWQILLQSQGIHVPLRRLYALYLIGRFFSNFLPSNVGGDVVRGYELGNYTQDGVKAMASVFMERLTGFIVLIVAALFSFFIQLRFMQDVRLLLAMAFATIGLVGVLWVILDPRPLLLIACWVKLPLVKKYIPKLQQFHSSLNAYKSHKQALVLSILWSMIFMGLAITNVYVAARAFYQPVSFLEITVIVPVILVVALLPLTFNGLGIQEWGYVLLFSTIGLPASVGLSTVILIRGKETLIGILGGLLYPIIKLAKERPATNGSQKSPVFVKLPKSRGLAEKER